MKHRALLYEKFKSDKVKCNLCPHECLIAEGKAGVCRVRKNIGGNLYSLNYGDAIAASADPIEKKPLYHFMPGSKAYSVAAPGCNFHCEFCQNWRISQIDGSYDSGAVSQKLMPEEIAENAVKSNCLTIAYTYTEPTIFFEYALDTAKIAAERGLKNIFVTNGYIKPEALDMIAPYLDGANVDLKYFSDKSYKKICGGSLSPVLRAIEKMKELDIWVEVTTLIIPGDNDSAEELFQIAEFIYSVDPAMPWHISAFTPRYKYSGRKATGIDILRKAEQIGKDAGLKYIYLGNITGEPGTLCPACKRSLISRNNYSITIDNIKSGRCLNCGTQIEGVWK
ncbi:MAG: AmmeMemoRadiSam system radical SAM enzyme [Elusimicrobia bacterium]|jgi:pyruvate formate lyase activating enzyme|nr:AmmeMemoRadiSam system radical SAM enzyme [Elusimicrobiota bacterium]